MPYNDDDYRILGLQGKSRDREDMLGADHQEILGAEEILGAMERLGARNPALQQAVARRIGQHTPVVKTVAPTKKRRYPIAFGPVGIAAGASAKTSTKPQELFRGEKLICRTTPATCLDDVFIDGMFVGSKSQLPTLENSVSSATFEKGVLDNEMMFDTADPAITILFQLTNQGEVDVTWSASLIGHTVL